MGPKKYFQTFSSSMVFRSMWLVWDVVLKNIDFEAKNSHFLDLCSKLPEMTDFGLKINIWAK